MYDVQISCVRRRNVLLPVPSHTYHYTQSPSASTLAKYNFVPLFVTKELLRCQHGGLQVVGAPVLCSPMVAQGKKLKTTDIKDDRATMYEYFLSCREDRFQCCLCVVARERMSSCVAWRRSCSDAISASPNDVALHTVGIPGVPERESRSGRLPLWREGVLDGSN